MLKLKFKPLVLKCFNFLVKHLPSNSIVEIKLKKNKVYFIVGIKNVQIEKALFEGLKSSLSTYKPDEIDFIDAIDGTSLSGATPTSFVRVIYDYGNAVEENNCNIKDFNFKLHLHLLSDSTAQEFLNCLDSYLTLTTNNQWHALGVVTE